MKREEASTETRLLYAHYKTLHLSFLVKIEFIFEVKSKFINVIIVVVLQTTFMKSLLSR